jgi:hypothetical protein
MQEYYQGAKAMGKRKLFLLASIQDAVRIET